MEIKKEIESYSSTIEISNLGKVYIDGKEISQWADKFGYMHVYLNMDGTSKQYAVHRLVAKLFCERLDSRYFVDHIDRDPTNNKTSNLRWSTNSENQKNQNRRSDNKSGFKGVSWHKVAKKWATHIRHKGKKTYLGLYSNPIEAAIRYDKEAIMVGGEYATTNKSLGLLGGNECQN